MSDPESLTGLWEGAYAFSTAELGECPFKVRMREEDGTLRGMVVEQHTEKDEQVRAEFEGTRSNGSRPMSTMRRPTTGPSVTPESSTLRATA